MRPPRILVALVVAVPLVAGACGGGSSAPRGPLAPNEVLVANFSFRPQTMTVAVGTTVTWTFDQPEAPHNVVSLSLPVLFNSGTPQGKGTYRFTFTQPGTYTYICQVHPYMRGTVVVTP